MSRVLKIAILGGSNKSAVGRAHVAAIRMSGRFLIEAGFMSRDQRVNLDSGLEYGIGQDKIFDSMEELLSYSTKNDLIVLICTPTNLHAEQVIRCVTAGLRVIVEKAISTNVLEAQEIVKKLNGMKNRLYVIFNYTSYPAVRYLQEAVSKGELGTPLKINITMPQESFIKRDLSKNPLTPQAWRLSDGEIPTISLDLGVHLHSLVKFISGSKAKSVVSIEGKRGNFANVVDDVQAISKYDRNLDVYFWYSKVALGHRNGMKIEIYGTEGSIIWEQESPEKIKFSNLFGEISLIDRGTPTNNHGSDARYNHFKPGHPTGFIEALSNYYTDIYYKFTSENEIDDEPTRVFGAEEALEGLQFLEAVHKSAYKNEWIEVVY